MQTGCWLKYVFSVDVIGRPNDTYATCISFMIGNIRTLKSWAAITYFVQLPNIIACLIYIKLGTLLINAHRRQILKLSFDEGNHAKHILCLWTLTCMMTSWNGNAFRVVGIHRSPMDFQQKWAVMQSFDSSFVLSLNQLVTKQLICQYAKFNHALGLKMRGERNYMLKTYTIMSRIREEEVTRYAKGVRNIKPQNTRSCHNIFNGKFRWQSFGQLYVSMYKEILAHAANYM